jgi:hypothetical protein
MGGYNNLKRSSMEKIPTAEEFLIRSGCQRMNCDGENCDFFEDVQPEDLIGFAKLHVEAALKAASERYEYDEIHISDNPEFLKDSILNSYPLENIK